MRWTLGCCGLLTLSLFAMMPAADEAPRWGKVVGQVVWADKEIPKREVEVVDKDKQHCLEKGPILSEKWVINPENKGVRWVFAWLAPDGDAQQQLPVHPDLQEVNPKRVEMDQPCCVFIPHALGVRQGQELHVKNSAPVPHDVRWAGSPRVNPPGDVLVPGGGAYTIKELRKDRMPILVSCNIHFWMKAYVRVFDHPYFAVTDADGKFTIDKAPAGPCRLVIWHEAAGYCGGAKGEAITIKADGPTDLGKLALKASE